MKKFIYIIILLILFFSCPESSLNNKSDDSEEITPPDNPPSDLSLNAVSFCRIIVTWTDNSNNESEFIIERSTNNKSS